MDGDRLYFRQLLSGRDLARFYAPDPSATLGERRASNSGFRPRSLEEWMALFGC